MTPDLSIALHLVGVAFLTSVVNQQSHQGMTRSALIRDVPLTAAAVVESYDVCRADSIVRLTAAAFAVGWS